jgi:DNA-directed RNA polymerase specialized sigma24 family protein
MHLGRGGQTEQSGWDLLQRLLDAEDDVSGMWRAFLRRYSDLILKIIWQWERDHDAVMDRYVYICARLAEDDFARLRRFDPSGRSPRPKVSTWLTVVVRNLCIEQHRQQEGRQRYPNALVRMSAFDREVFRLHYWEGYPVAEIEHMVAPTEGHSVSEALRRIQALALRPSRTWNRPKDRVRFVDYAAHFGARNGQGLPDLISDEQRQWLDRMLEQMPREARLVIKFRFWDDLSGPQIARLLQITPRRVYYVLSKALDDLRERALVRRDST